MENTIHDKPEKSKSEAIIEPFFVPALITLLALCGFGLYKLMELRKNHQPVTIEYTVMATSTQAAVAAATTAATSAPKNPAKSAESVVASKKGKYYYYLSCGGAKRLSAANKVTFASAEAAQKAGYKLSSACKPQ